MRKGPLSNRPEAETGCSLKIRINPERKLKSRENSPRTIQNCLKRLNSELRQKYSRSPAAKKKYSKPSLLKVGVESSQRTIQKNSYQLQSREVMPSQDYYQISDSLFSKVYEILDESMCNKAFMVDLIHKISRHEKRVETEILELMKMVDPKCDIRVFDSCLVPTLQDIKLLFRSKLCDESKFREEIAEELSRKIEQLIEENNSLDTELKMCNRELGAKEERCRSLKRDFGQLELEFEELILQQENKGPMEGTLRS
jgi:hypothetical protein